MDAEKPVTTDVLKRKLPWALFLHIQKTAGSSIVDIVRKYYGEDMTSHGDHLGHDSIDFKDVHFVSGHFGYEFAKPLMAHRYSFTFLRDPAKRILSLYFFCRGQDSDEFPMYKFAQEHDLEDFLQAGFNDSRVKTHIWNNQTWQLACGYANHGKKHTCDFEPSDLLKMAKVHLNDFSHVGFTETFEEDRDIILSSLGLPIPEGRVESNVNQSRGRVTDISSEAVGFLQELTILDRTLYEYAWKKYKDNKMARQSIKN